MAKTITQLPDATVVNGSDELIIQQSGVTKKATKTEVLAGIVNANIDAAAAIALSKLATGALPTAITVASANIVNGTIVNDDVSGSAAIAGTKIAPDFGSQNVVTTGSVRLGGATSGSVSFASQSDASASPQLSLTNNGDNSNSAFVVLSKRRAGNIVNNGDGAGTIAWTAFDGSTTSTIAQIAANIDAVPGAGDMPGRLTFNTAPAGTNVSVARMTIKNSGNVGIGTTSPNAAALVDVASTTQGFLPPRMTTAQRDAISTPPAGLMIYNTTTNKLNVRTASSWEAVTSS